MLRTLTAWLIVLALVVGITGGLALYKYRQIEAAIAAASAMPEMATAVATAEAGTGQWTAMTRSIGTVVALRTLEVRNETAGTVARIGFRSGDIVEEGQVLIGLDDRAEVAALAAVDAEARLAEQTLARRERLRDSAAFSEQEYDRAEQALVSARARAEGLRVAIDKKRITAPFKARIGITDLQAGAYLEAGTLIAKLQGVEDDAYIDFALAQDDAAIVRAGTTVTITSLALPGGTATATIEAESEGIDPRSRTVRFRARLTDHGGRLRPGMFVDVATVTSEPRSSVLVPVTAVRRTTHGQHVFVITTVDGKLRAQQRSIETGPVQGGSVAVLSGLAAGEVVATSGSFKLRDQALVETAPPPAATPAPATSVN
ncbi:MAG: efflux RND transporter periplasmic adaptor subunit [Hyphomicrobiaceae bacterium]|nr:efflux RND transporter periplasmic adaptor subunit [Hyphomicrobiaceae bacterium]